MTTGLIIFAHGSRIESANESVRAVARQLAEMGPFGNIEPAFLELGQPDLPGAAGRLIQQGVRKIIVIPYFLTLGIHLERDLPQLVAELSAAHPDVEFRVTPPLDGHPALLQILLDRSKEVT